MYVCMYTYMCVSCPPLTVSWRMSLQTGPRSGFLHSYGAGNENKWTLRWRYVCLCISVWLGVLFPGSTALNPGAVSPSCTGTLSTPSTGRFGLGAAGGHAAGHATCGEHTRQQY